MLGCRHCFLFTHGIKHVSYSIIVIYVYSSKAFYIVVRFHVTSINFFSHDKATVMSLE